MPGPRRTSAVAPYEPYPSPRIMSPAQMRLLSAVAPALASGARGAAGYAYKRARNAVFGAPNRYQKNRHAVNEAYTPSIRVKRRRKTSRRAKGPIFSKRQKKSIKAITRSETDYELVKDSRGAIADGFYAPYNEVVYHTPSDNKVVSTILTECAWFTRDTVTPTGTKAQQVDQTNQKGAKIKYMQEHVFEISNNSNCSGEMRIYVFRCSEYTNDSPMDELNNMMTARYSTSSAYTNLNKDFNQYMSVEGKSRTVWKKSQEFRIQMKGGETTQQHIKLAPMTIDVNRWIFDGKTSYTPGSSFIVIRARGKITHTNVEVTPPVISSHPGLYSHQIVGFFAVDYLNRFRSKYEVQGAADVLLIRNTGITAGLRVPATLAEKPVEADPEAVGLGDPVQK